MMRVLMLSLLAAVAVAEPFRQDERVAFVGDSITHGGGYHNLVQYFYATRFPERHVACFNVGISGDNAHGGTQRASAEGEGIWESDVRMYKPTAATVMLGMNDVGGWQFGTAKTKEELMGHHEQMLGWYKANYATLLDNLEQLGIDRIALIKSSPYDQTMVNSNATDNLLKFGFGKNDAIIDFAEKSIDVEGGTRGYAVCDFNTPMLEINAERQKLDPAFSIIGNDRVHPGEMGHTVMGYTFLKFQGLESPVAEVTLRPNSNDRKWDAKNCTISGLKMGSSQITFDYKAKSLPLVEQSYTSAKNLIPFEQEFNRELLTVKGLSEGMYKLTIGNKAVGIFSHDEFDEGLNLALENTPQRQQSQMVYLMCLQQKKMMAEIRDVVWSVGYLGKIKGHDSSDKAANLEMIKRIDDGFEPEGLWAPPSAYEKGVLANYVKFVDQYESRFESLEKMIDGIYETAQPMMYRVQITKIK